MSHGGVNVSLDALGSPTVFADALASLAKRGRHVQVGLMPGATPPVPIERFIAEELELVGSHGMQAHRYAEMFNLLEQSRLDPGALVSETLTLEQAATLLATENLQLPAGVAVINRFGGI